MWIKTQVQIEKMITTSLQAKHVINKNYLGILTISCHYKVATLKIKTINNLIQQIILTSFHLRD